MTAPYEERAEEVMYLLEQCGLARYVPAFKNDDVDDSCLETLTPEDLVDLGLPMGPRVRLARAIRERNAAAASVAPSLPPPPPLPVSLRAATPPPRDDDDDDDDLCVMCMDSKIDCKLKPCGHALFCRACVANWRQQSAAKPKGPSCPKCREPFGAADVVDLDGRPLDAPRPVAWGGAAAPVVPFPGAAEAEERRRREAEARAAADADALRRRREAEAVRARERREAEMYAAAEAEARRRREAEARAALNAVALATSIAAKDAEQWARRGVRVDGADIQRQARYHARQCDRDNDAAFVEAYVAAATGAFEDAEARAAVRVAAFDLARLARDRQNAEAAVISAFICEVLAACRREAAAAAIAEVETANRKLTEIAGEVLMLVDAHGGTIGTNSLPIVYQKWYGKDLDYPGKLTTFLKDLPGVELIPRISPRFPSWIRRATAPAPAPAPSRSASPDPTAAPWTPPPPAACVPYPIYAYPPPAYFVPLPPPMPYGLPVPMPPMSNNPFVLQPIPWEQAGVAHDPVTAERPRPGRMSELVRQAQRERRREARRGAAQADVSK